MQSLALWLLLSLSLALLGSGCLLRSNACHILRALGWIIFGIYWYWQFPYWLVHDNGVNMLGTMFALPVFIFMAYHEYLSWKWNDEYEPLRFLAAACFSAMTVFFIIEAIPAVSAAIIRIVSDQTTGLINLFTHADYSTISVDLGGNSWWLTTTDNEIAASLAHNGITSKVSIVLACTGIQAMVASFAFIACNKAPWKRMVKTIAIIIPTIYIVNLFRNALVVYAVDFSILGDSTFDIVHNIIGKIVISMTTLVVLMVVAFIMVPEFYENINGAFELPWRKAPGHDYRKHIGRLIGPQKRKKGRNGNKISHKSKNKKVNQKELERSK